MDPEPATGQHSFKFSVLYGLEESTLPSRQQLRAWAKRALLGPAEVGLRIVNRREGRALNRQFRGKDYAPNVLTFAYGKTHEGLQQGDIAICWPVIAEEARAQKKTRWQHMAHMVIHGMLHLQGLDHTTQKEAKVMEALEVSILRQIGLPDPYQS